MEQVSIGYTKGEASTTTLHAFLVWCWKTGVNIKSVHPVLWESVCVIYLHMFEPNSQLAAAMSNMKISSRGDVRRSNNIIEICVMIKEMGSVDVGLFQRTWNKQSAREHQIIGRKASALNNIFDLGPEIVDSILGHVNLLGWQDAVWSDDNLAGKKIYPRYQFPSKSKKWTQSADIGGVHAHHDQAGQRCP